MEVTIMASFDISGTDTVLIGKSADPTDRGWEGLLGSTISHYRILTKIGGGGMGVVYRAEDLELGRTVALKFLPPGVARESDARQRFVAEARMASSLDHPNICTVHEIGHTDDGKLFIAMPCYEGETLKAKLSRGPLDAARAEGIALGVVRGLIKAHGEGIVHRDIKPANVFITNDGQVKILDFGLAKLIDDAADVGGMLIGTVGYLSPEQVRSETVDHRSDLWSFGVMLYEMLTGRRPFSGHHPNAVFYAILNEDPPPPTALVDGLPDHLTAIIARALAKDPADRFASAQQIEEHLQPTEQLGNTTPRAPRTVAVLPFRNGSSEPEQEYFCDGMAEEIINGLAMLDGLRVVARSSSFAFKGQQVDVRDVGRRLEADALVEGCVRKVGDRLRITVLLVDAARGFHIWSGRYDRQMEDIFALQEDIASQIVRELRVTMQPDQPKIRIRKATGDVQAYDFYLKGREYLYQLTRRSLEFARDMFAHAWKIDPRFALAYAGAADACSFLCMWFDRSQELLDEADTLSRKAIELDPVLAEGHAARGLALSLNRCYAGAAEAFQRATELNPSLFEAYYFHGRDATAQGHLEEAAELFRRAGDARPEDYQSVFLRAQALRGLDRHEEARIVAKGGIAKAERHLDLFPEDTRALYLGAAALVILGEVERGLQWAQQAATLDPEEDGMLYQLACIYALAGQTDQAIAYLETWEQRGALPREWLENDSDLDALRDQPRFRALMARL
jgi:non-specific serine/threonine protein kinase